MKESLTLEGGCNKPVCRSNKQRWKSL